MVDVNGASMAGRQVLVTGARGFLGSRLVERLAQAGARVHAVTRRHRRWDARNPIRWHTVDLSDAAATMTLVDAVRPNVIFHLAGQVTGSRDHRLVLPTMRNNLNGTVHLLSAALETGPTRVVLAGSIEEPGPGDGAASSPYAVTKWAATGYGQMCHALWDLPVTMLRISLVYGPGQYDVGKLVPHVVLATLQGQPAQLSSGVRAIDWVYVDDVVDAFAAAAVQPDATGRVIPIGSGELVSIRDTVGLIGKLVAMDGPEPQFGALPDRRLDRDRATDLDPAASVLGWRPRVGLEEGMARTVEWYREQLATGRFGHTRRPPTDPSVPCVPVRSGAGRWRGFRPPGDPTAGRAG